MSSPSHVGGGSAHELRVLLTLCHLGAPNEHQSICTSHLRFLPVTTIDNKQRPSASILAGPDGHGFATKCKVNEAIRNCPKYINIREFVPFSDTHSHIVYRALGLSPEERLPHDVISFIHESDTLFLGTYYNAEEEDRERFASHVLGINHRGDKVGFARSRPND
ncbi:hypothetical protein PAXINDRAFT_14127 [Paxillus involutus ATCC 200175]|uniref:Uncharacterized protein n=1 Tax=Paxillus involutus ATCC 200175 TaxID=664439 RepID=A0A0C9SV08_PAXIN|nr:hypothetical protein PAXINDRAFT_14127 [Paxillus involutus ATCC 200175]